MMKLHVKVIGGKSLPARNSEGELSPYIILKYDSQVQQTAVLNNTVNPYWNQSFSFDVKDIKSKGLIVQLFDHEIAKDRQFDEFVLDVSGLKEKRIKKDIHKLDKVEGQKHRPSITFQLQLLKEDQNPWDSGKKLLQIMMHNARHFQCIDPSGKNQILVELSVSGRSVFTTARKDDFEPNWEELFEMRVKDIYNDCLTFKLIDQLTDTIISQYDLALEELPERKEIKLSRTLVPSNSSIISPGDISFSITIIPADAEKTIKKVKKASKCSSEDEGSSSSRKSLDGNLKTASGSFKSIMSIPSLERLHSSLSGSIPKLSPNSYAEEIHKPSLSPYHYTELFCFLNVKEAKDIEPINSFCRVSFGKADPIETGVIMKSSHPQWAKVIKMKLRDLVTGAITIELVKRRKDGIGEQLYGTVQVPFNELCPGVPSDKWYPFQEKTKPGRLHLELHIARGEDTPFIERPFNILHLDLQVFGIENAPRVPGRKISSIYLITRLSGTYIPYKTLVSTGPTCEWNDHYDIPIASGTDGVIHFWLFENRKTDNPATTKQDIRTALADLETFDMLINETYDKYITMKSSSSKLLTDDDIKLHIKYRLYPARNPATDMRQVTVSVEEFTSSYYSYVEGDDAIPSLTSSNSFSSAPSLSSSPSFGSAPSLSDDFIESQRVKKTRISRYIKTESMTMKGYGTMADQLNLNAKITERKGFKQESYCVITMGGESRETKKSKAGWDDTLVLLQMETNDIAYIQVISSDGLPIGNAQVFTENMKPGLVYEEWIDLDDPSGARQKGAAGSIHVVCQLAHKNRKPFIEYTLLTPVLNIQLIECTNIPKCDALLSFGMKGSTSIINTDVIKATSHPVWNKLSVIPVDDIGDECLSISLYDNANTEEPLSGISMLLKDMSFGEIYDDWFEMTPIASTKGGQVHIKFQLGPDYNPPFAPFEDLL